MSDRKFQKVGEILDKAGIKGKLYYATRLNTTSGAEVYRLAVVREGTTTGYYAKFHTDSHFPVEERRSYRAYRTALKLAPIFSNISSCFRVAVPVYYDATSACLITKCEGTSTYDLIRNGGRYRVGFRKETDLQDAVKGAADWLKCLWRVTGTGERKTFSVTSLKEPPWSWDDRLRKCCDDGILSNSFAESLKTMLIEKMAALDGVEYPLVGGHWDFRPPNVVVSGPRITVVDWTTYRTCRTPYWDAAGFWADLGNISINPAVRPGLIRNLQNSFAKAIASELNPELFWVWRVEAVLYLATCGAGFSNTRKLTIRGRLVRWFSRFHYRRALSALATEAKGC